MPRSPFCPPAPGLNVIRAGKGAAMTIGGLRVGSMSVDGTPISETDLARIEAEEKLHEDLERRTVRVIAGAAHDAQDCRVLLDMLGIDPAAIEAARAARAKKPKARRTARKPAARSGRRVATA